MIERSRFECVMICTAWDYYSSQLGESVKVEAKQFHATCADD